MKKFTLGVMAGASSLLVAVPLLATLSSAQSSISSSTTTGGERPIPSQACVSALAAQEDFMLSNMDAMHATHKTTMTAHRDALTAAAAITDDTARQEALKTAHEAMRTAMEAAMESAPDPTATMEAVRDACGDMFMFHGGKGMKMGKMFRMGHGGPGGPGGMGGGFFLKHMRMAPPTDAATDAAASTSVELQ